MSQPPRNGRTVSLGSRNQHLFISLHPCPLLFPPTHTINHFHVCSIHSTLVTSVLKTNHELKGWMCWLWVRFPECLQRLEL